MNLSCTIALLGALSLGQTPANLDFSRKSLDKWEGSGFVFTAGDKELPAGAWSPDATAKSRKGMIRNVFTVPAKATRLTFRAFASLGDDDPNANLDVLLMGRSNVPVARKVKISLGWVAAPKMLDLHEGKPREYSWDLSGLQGQTVQIVLVDNDSQPNRFVYASGFKFHEEQVGIEQEFAKFMLGLQTKNGLNSFARFDSKRFLAISNASEAFSADRLKNCEIFYDHFMNHYKKAGFQLHTPSQRMMIAVFHSHEGFDAYFGQKMPAGIAGVYHTPTNRLVLYDLSENRVLAASRKNALQQGGRIDDTVERVKYLGAMERRFQDVSNEMNLSTTMHECAHLISFNCGLFNREGDASCWVVEGMATYCESTDQGDWTALGGPNPMRIGDLMRARGKFIPLADMIRNDKWRNTNQVLTGYAQSWAFYHMLMKQEPAKLRAYLQLIYDRKTPDHREADFIQTFGDIQAMERRHVAYIRSMIAEHPPAAFR